MQKTNIQSIDNKARNPWKNSNLGEKIVLGMLTLTIGACGYGLKSCQNSYKDITQEHVIQTTKQAVRLGYVEQIWKQIPQHERYRLAQDELGRTQREPIPQGQKRYEREGIREGAAAIYRALKERFKAD